MRFAIKHFVVVLIICLGGCAASPEDMQEDILGFELPKLPGPGQAVVYVVRPSEEAEEARLSVYLDGRDSRSEMGYTLGEEYIYFSVTPGEHTVYSKAERWAETRVAAKEGDIIFLSQEPDTELLTLRNIIVRIQEYAGRYHVKNLRLGTVIRETKE